MNRFQLGYRKRETPASYAAPYTELPAFEMPWNLAYDLHAKLQEDFPEAEWRLVEIINKSVAMVCDTKRSRLG